MSKYKHNTGDETLVSMTTKIIELLIFQKMTKHVLDVIRLYHNENVFTPWLMHIIIELFD